MREDIQDYIIENQLTNMPLKDIVEGIEKEFSVKMTKQNVSKFYNRYLTRSSREIEEQCIVKDCVEVMVRRKYMKDCWGSELIPDVTKYKFKKYITDNETLVEKKRESLKNKIIELYTEGLDISEIAEETSYKGMVTAERVVLDVINENISNTGLNKEQLTHDIKE